MHMHDHVKRYACQVATRRSPSQAERRRDPERARQRLLDAAAEEFGAKGFGGARVRDIAERAGLNMQLISYYFGGKAGLYAELQRRWGQASRGLARPDQPLDQVVVGFLKASEANRPWARLLAWQGLSGDTPAATRPELMQWIAAELARRQQAGELAADLDPGFAALALFAAAAAPAILPHVARELTGRDPESQEFSTAYAEHLGRLVRRLRDQPTRPPDRRRGSGH
jgi:TetR/AcrR family transcriptional regulator